MAEAKHDKVIVVDEVFGDASRKSPRWPARDSRTPKTASQARRAFLYQ
jgi:hypothetical protein